MSEALGEVVRTCMEAEEQWTKHPNKEHRPCETGSRVQFARRIMNALGFCIKCGESMPCMTCGLGDEMPEQTKTFMQEHKDALGKPCPVCDAKSDEYCTTEPELSIHLKRIWDDWE